jgi:hypothetical protein
MPISKPVKNQTIPRLPDSVIETECYTIDHIAPKHNTIGTTHDNSRINNVKKVFSGTWNDAGLKLQELAVLAADEECFLITLFDIYKIISKVKTVEKARLIAIALAEILEPSHIVALTKWLFKAYYKHEEEIHHIEQFLRDGTSDPLAALTISFLRTETRLEEHIQYFTRENFYKFFKDVFLILIDDSLNKIENSIDLSSSLTQENYNSIKEIIVMFFKNLLSEQTIQKIPEIIKENCKTIYDSSEGKKDTNSNLQLSFVSTYFNLLLMGISVQDTIDELFEIREASHGLFGISLGSSKEKDCKKNIDDLFQDEKLLAGSKITFGRSNFTADLKLPFGNIFGQESHGFKEIFKQEIGSKYITLLCAFLANIKKEETQQEERYFINYVLFQHHHKNLLRNIDNPLNCKFHALTREWTTQFSESLLTLGKKLYPMAINEPATSNIASFNTTPPSNTSKKKSKKSSPAEENTLPANLRAELEIHMEKNLMPPYDTFLKNLIGDTSLTTHHESLSTTSTGKKEKQETDHHPLYRHYKKASTVINAAHKKEESALRKEILGNLTSKSHFQNLPKEDFYFQKCNLLYEAVATDNLDLIKALVEKQSNFSDLSTHTLINLNEIMSHFKDSFDLIYLIVYFDRQEILKFLLQQRSFASVDLNNPSFGTTPLRLAAFLGYVEMAKLLVSTKKIPFHGIEEENSDTPLMIAVKNEQVEMVRYLLSLYHNEKNQHPLEKNSNEETVFQIAENKNPSFRSEKLKIICTELYNYMMAHGLNHELIYLALPNFSPPTGTEFSASPRPLSAFERHSSSASFWSSTSPSQPTPIGTVPKKISARVLLEAILTEKKDFSKSDFESLLKLNDNKMDLNAKFITSWLNTHLMEFITTSSEGGYDNNSERLAKMIQLYAEVLIAEELEECHKALKQSIVEANKQASNPFLKSIIEDIINNLTTIEKGKTPVFA